MSTPESKLWLWFDKHVGKKLDYCERIETKREDGLPDVMIVNNSRTIFIELKQNVQAHRPKYVPLRKDQIMWWEKFTRAGGVGYILFKYNIDKMVMIGGKFARAISEDEYFWEEWCQWVIPNDDMGLYIRNVILLATSD